MIEFQPGQRVRFRLGERESYTMPCCGKVINDWQDMVDFGLTAGVFTIFQPYILHSGTLFQCDHCHQTHQIIPGLPFIYLRHEFTCLGKDRAGFGAYPEELTLVGVAGGANG